MHALPARKDGLVQPLMAIKTSNVSLGSIQKDCLSLAHDVLQASIAQMSTELLFSRVFKALILLVVRLPVHNAAVVMHANLLFLMKKNHALKDHLLKLGKHFAMRVQKGSSALLLLIKLFLIVCLVPIRSVISLLALHALPGVIVIRLTSLLLYALLDPTVKALAHLAHRVQLATCVPLPKFLHQFVLEVSTPILTEPCAFVVRMDLFVLLEHLQTILL